MTKGSRNPRAFWPVALLLLLVSSGLLSGGVARAGLPTALPSSGSAAVPAAATPARIQIWVLRVYYSDNAERDRLAVSLGAEEMGTKDGYLTVFADNDLLKKIQSQKLRYEIDQKETDKLSDPHLFGNTFYNGYKTVEEMQTYLNQLAATYPTLAQVVPIGPSWCKANPGQCTQPNANNGYDVLAMHITNQAIAGPKPVFWYEGGIHAREIAVPEIAMRYISMLLDGYANDPDAHWLVDYNDIWVVPMLNPDGHHIVESGGGGSTPYYQRKNANHSNGCNTWPPSSGTQFGTDNNRNFVFQWNCCGGSSTDPCSQTYHGASAGSDPETQASQNQVRLLIPDQRGPNLTDPAPITTTGVFQDMHSNASLNLYPWGFQTGAAPNGPELANIGKHLSATNASPAGNGYTSCQPPNCLYAVDGDANDWAYGELGAASYTTEVGGTDFLVPLTYVDSTLFPANKGPLLYEAKVSRQPYLMAHGPDTSAVATNPMTVTQGTVSQLSATINFAWTGNTFAQNVGAAEYYIDTPPWAPGANATAMSGTFGGSQTVNATATIDTINITPGRHLIFVRGRGVNPFQGNFTWGPVTAAWLTVQPVQGTPTPTVTGTPPTATRTSTPSATSAIPTATPTTCASNSNYTFTSSTGATIVPGTTDTGNHCDDCLTSITLPFPLTLYDQSFTAATVDSNGTLQLVAGASNFQNSCLPQGGATYTIYGYWDDLINTAAGQGVYTSVTGTAPNRVFNVEWRAYIFNTTNVVNFEIQLNETSPNFKIIYGTAVANNGSGATSGVQKDDTHSTQFSCNTGTLTPGLQLNFTLPPCGTPLPTSTTGPATQTPTVTQVLPTGTATAVQSTATRTAAPATSSPTVIGSATSILPTSTVGQLTPTTTTLPGTPTMTAQASGTAVSATGTAIATAVSPTATSTVCSIQFTDVPSTNTFYPYVRCLACRGIVSGYQCGGRDPLTGDAEPCDPNRNPYFRYNDPITRGQISKLVSNSAGFSEEPGAQIYEDVPLGSPFYPYINRLSMRQVMGGYPCGQRPTETCIAPLNRPYFRPGDNATRGQLSKIVSNAAGYSEAHTEQTFEDVGTVSTFYIYIQRLASRGAMAGYPCGGINPETQQAEPCDAQNRAYFRPGNTVTRGQAAKITANTFFQNCQSPQR